MTAPRSPARLPRQAARRLLGRRPLVSLLVVATGAVSAALESADVEQWWVVPLSVLLLLAAAGILGRDTPPHR